MSMKKYTFTFDEKTISLLENFAKNYKVSMSAVLRILINKHCKLQDKKTLDFGD